MIKDNAESTAERQVVACVDGSTFTDAVCDYAAWLSQRVSAPLQLLHAIAQPLDQTLDLSGALGVDSQAALLQELTELEATRNKILIQRGKTLLDGAKQRVTELGVAQVSSKLRHGTLTEALIDVEEQTRCVVMGIKGEQAEEKNKPISAFLESRVRAIHRPVLVVNRAFKTPEHVMLAFDGSTASAKAIDLLCESPAFRDVVLHLVTVDNYRPQAEEYQRNAVARLEASGCRVVPAVIESKYASQGLCDYQASHAIDLIMMGAFSHSRLRDMLLGSLTTKMLLEANTPLLLLR